MGGRGLQIFEWGIKGEDFWGQIMGIIFWWGSKGSFFGGINFFWGKYFFFFGGGIKGDFFGGEGRGGGNFLYVHDTARGETLSHSHKTHKPRLKDL